MGQTVKATSKTIRPNSFSLNPRPLLALSSAVLLIFSFPNFNQAWCAWLALVPWLLALRGLIGRKAFWWSWLVGLVFFLGSMWWLVYVTVVGWIALCAYLAIYFGVFGWTVAGLNSWGRRQETGDRSLVSRLMSPVQLLFIPATWVALEYARSHLLSGLGWNLLAYSQVSWTALIQCADVTGVWGVSFLLVFVNSIVAMVLAKEFRPRARARWVFAAAVCLTAALGYGVWRIPHVMRGQMARVAVVQGNVPQEEKWDEAHQGDIVKRYAALTDAALATKPDLIVWPETSVPGYLGLDEAVTQPMMALADAIKVPLLVGAPMGRLAGAAWQMTNSAILIDAEGVFNQRYDKLHMVPFGEFIPFESVAPWLRSILPPIGNFVPGHHYTVFASPVRNSEFGIRSDHSALRTPHSELKFSVLICFEDIFPDLARRFVQRGARMLLVITNDAWFGPTAAAYQHAQASAFRAVELRVPVARAANTGWSGCIDPAGRWGGSVRDAQGAELFVEGTHTCDLPLGRAQSLYLRFGDWFAWLCLFVTLSWAIRRMLSHS